MARWRDGETAARDGELAAREMGRARRARWGELTFFIFSAFARLLATISRHVLKQASEAWLMKTLSPRRIAWLDAASSLKQLKPRTSLRPSGE